MAKGKEDSGLGVEMPVITLSASDLKSLIGKPVPDDQLETVLPLIKCEIETWDDDEVKVEVTPDRPDLLSTEGIARQVAYWLGIRRGLQGYITTKPRISITANTVKPRPEIVAGSVKGVKMSDSMVRSIMQLQEAIDFTIGRDRIKTAIGIHDSTKVKPPFFYREVGPRDISFVPLGFSREMTIEKILKEHPKGVQYNHVFSRGKTYPIIVDKNDEVISFPPIINGELTKVTPETKDIFIDITGFDQTPLNHALNILLAALEMRGGKVEAVKINGRSFPHLKARPMSINKDSVKAMLGVNLKDSEIKDCLERMGYGFDIKSNRVLVPPFRADIMHPVDVIEDIAIAYGYNDFTPEIPSLPTIGRPDPEEEFSIKLKHLMVGLGFQEMVNLSLSNEEKQFRQMSVKKPAVIEISNPVSKDYVLARHWILPSLLENLNSNIHRRYPQRIFELSEVLYPDPSRDSRTRNVKKLACAVTHSDAGFSEIMSLLNAFSEVLPLELSTTETSHPSFIPGRCVSIKLGKKEIGVLGEIHPLVLQGFGLKMPVAGFEISVEEIWKSLSRT
jgi:phenylalanyl-tRNA synthetase beta chain